MVYSLLLHPHTQTSNAFVQLQVNQGRPHAGHSSRTVHISCSRAIDTDVTLVDAIICTTESNIDVREGTMHLRHCKGTSRSVSELLSHIRMRASLVSCPQIRSLDIHRSISKKGGRSAKWSDTLATLSEQTNDASCSPLLTSLSFLVPVLMLFLQAAVRLHRLSFAGRRQHLREILRFCSSITSVWTVAFG